MNSSKGMGKHNYWLGKKRPESTKAKMRIPNPTHFKKGHIPYILEKEKNGSWKGGSSFDPYSFEWSKTLRRSIRERDNYICKVCSKLQGDYAFDIHHIDYNKKNCNPDNLITLCRSCHMKTNYNREYWKEYFIKLLIG